MHNHTLVVLLLYSLVQASRCEICENCRADDTPFGDECDTPQQFRDKGEVADVVNAWDDDVDAYSFGQPCVFHTQDDEDPVAVDRTGLCVLADLGSEASVKIAMGKVLNDGVAKPMLQHAFKTTVVDTVAELVKHLEAGHCRTVMMAPHTPMDRDDARTLKDTLEKKGVEVVLLDSDEPIVQDPVQHTKVSWLFIELVAAGGAAISLFLFLVFYGDAVVRAQEIERQRRENRRRRRRNRLDEKSEKLRKAASSASPATTTTPPSPTLPSSSSGTQCIVCMEKDLGSVFLPCRHVCTCPECCQLIRSQPRKQRRCPVCRTMVKDSVDLFVSGMVVET